jgi:hypothetical protein
MTFPLEALYPSHPECLMFIFDLADPDGPAALDRQRDAMAGYASIEALDESRVALIVRPGWVSEAAA